MAMRRPPGFIAGILLAATLLLSGTGQVLAAQPSEQQVRQLMDAIGLGKSLSQMNTQVATSMQQALPCVSSNYWQDYMDENSSKDFVGRLVPIYQRHFTADEVAGMVKFYSSPLGQKVLTEMPLALAEANQAGQQWSREHTQQMIAKLEQAGTLGANGRCPASAFAGNPASAGSSADAPEPTGSDAAESANVAVAAPATSSRHHGHTQVKKHITSKKAAPVKKSAATRKSAPVKAATPSGHHTGTPPKPVSETHKTTPASQ